MMLLRTLYLHNFRAYKENFFEFAPGINTIYGANAQGKTTILEAIYLLITGSSFRTSQISDLIRMGEFFFYIEASFVKQGIEQKLRFSWDGKERKIVYNNTNLSSTSNLLGLLQGVVITPDEISLIKGAPLTRRLFLDLQLAQADALYVHHLTRYNRAMRQRNSLLRSKNLVTIESWEYEMANSAAYVVQERLRALSALQMSSKLLHRDLSGEEFDLNLIYKSGSAHLEQLSALRQYYLDSYQKLRYREMDLGYTLSGPHKDDFLIAIGDKDARFFASEGQQRSCVTALRLAEWTRLYGLCNEKPLMLIDDIGTSLDDGRKARLFAHLPNLGQIFITSTQKLAIDGSFHHINH